jgi:hypothetical protein
MSLHDVVFLVQFYFLNFLEKYKWMNFRESFKLYTICPLVILWIFSKKVLRMRYSHTEAKESSGYLIFELTSEYGK